ncbi:MAG: T9SS type A sorting domain-containing protein [Bacteroidota bacterium]
MRFRLLLCLCFLSVLTGKAQALFYNPNFDTYSSCPDDLGQVGRSDNWIEVVMSADFYNCNFQYYGSYPSGTPSYSGKGCMGFASYGDTKGSAEAIGQYLATSIVKGKSYSISLMAKKARSGVWSNDCGGVAMYGFKLTVPPSTFGLHVSDIAGTDLLALSPMVKDTGWKPQLLTFTAAESYSFVAFTVEKVPSCRTYIFIDSLDAKVEISSNVSEINTDALIRVFPNPGNGNVQVETTSIIDEIQVTDLVGRLVLHQNVGSDKYSFVLQEPGFYFVNVYSKGSYSKHKLIVQ